MFWTDQSKDQMVAVFCCRFDYEVVLGIQARGLDKANRLVYSETEMTHAMTFTGCHVVEVRSTHFCTAALIPSQNIIV